jgi:diadenosine tetraphosphate (Ap4A) HIT family hydrolase
MNESGFQLHGRLAQDTVEVARWDLSLLLLMRDGLWPWLILVPRRAGCREIHDLDAADRATLIEEIACAARALEQGFAADKINVGAIGNMVPQLHVHVIARHRTDPAWPKPVWGVLPAEPMDEAALAARLAQVRAALTAPGGSGAPRSLPGRR